MCQNSTNLGGPGGPAWYPLVFGAGTVTWCTQGSVCECAVLPCVLSQRSLFQCVTEPPGRVCASWHGEGLPHPLIIPQCLFYFAGMRASLGTMPKSRQALQFSCVPGVVHTSPCTRPARSMASALHSERAAFMAYTMYMKWRASREAQREGRWACGEGETEARVGVALQRDPCPLPEGSVQCRRGWHVRVLTSELERLVLWWTWRGKEPSKGIHPGTSSSLQSYR